MLKKATDLSQYDLNGQKVLDLLSLGPDSVKLPKHIEGPYTAAWSFFANAPHPYRILDVGCGTGIHSVELAKLGHQVRGVDLSEKSLAAARKLAEANGVSEKTTFDRLSIQQLFEESTTYDGIFAAGVLYYLKFEDVQKLIATQLKAGGLFAAVEPIGDNPLLNGYRHFRNWLKPYRDEASLSALWGNQEFEDLAKSQFSEYKIRSYGFFVLLTAPFRKTFLYPKLVLWAEKVDNLLLNTMGFKTWGFKLILTARK